MAFKPSIIEVYIFNTTSSPTNLVVSSICFLDGFLLLLCFIKELLAMSLEIFFFHNFSFHPRMTKNIYQGGSHWNWLWRSVDNILELLSNCWTGNFIFPPKLLVPHSVSWNCCISFIIFWSVLPRIVNNFCHEKHSTKCKNVSVFTLILSILNFWSHVAGSTKSWLCKATSVASTQVLSVSKVNYFELQIAGYHYILWF